MTDPLFLSTVMIRFGAMREFRRPDGALLGAGRVVERMVEGTGTGNGLIDDGDGTGAADEGTGSEGAETRTDEMETLVTVTVMDVVGEVLKRAVFVRSHLQGSRAPQSSSLVVNPVLDEPTQTQLVDVADGDNSADDDLACPLARVLQAAGLAAQTDTFTGVVFMQGQSQRQ
jgi:hypothetical protein